MAVLSLLAGVFAKLSRRDSTKTPKMKIRKDADCFRCSFANGKTTIDKIGMEADFIYCPPTPFSVG